MSSARRLAAKAAEQAAFFAACAEVQERLAEAKRAHRAEPSPETLAELRAAMDEAAKFRGYFRTITRIKRLQAALTDLGEDDPQRPAVSAHVAELYEQVGMEPGSLPAEAGPEKPGAVTAWARPISARNRRLD